MTLAAGWCKQSKNSYGDKCRSTPPGVFYFRTPAIWKFSIFTRHCVISVLRSPRWYNAAIRYSEQREQPDCKNIYIIYSVLDTDKSITEFFSPFSPFPLKWRLKIKFATVDNTSLLSYCYLIILSSLQQQSFKSVLKSILSSSSSLTFFNVKLHDSLRGKRWHFASEGLSCRKCHRRDSPRTRIRRFESSARKIFTSRRAVGPRESKTIGQKPKHERNFLC